MHTDAATKSGVLKIFEHSGKLKSLSDLRDLSESERDWFASGFEEYVGDDKHPVRAVHGLIHYGRVIYLLSLIYFLSMSTWLISIVNVSVEENRTISWNAVWIWLVSVAIINLAFTAYGVHLEILGAKHELKNSQRRLALLAIIVLSVAIVGNILAPYTQHSGAIAPHIFINGEL